MVLALRGPGSCAGEQGQCPALKPVHLLEPRGEKQRGEEKEGKGPEAGAAWGGSDPATLRSACAGGLPRGAQRCPLTNGYS